jgi:aspartyl-tRNA(Asn)/glutamyl-tRNA(Gln) amidotransferase subunit C
MILMKRVSKDLSEEDVEHIAWLARIELTDEEKKLFTDQFNTIIDYFHVIDEADTKDVKPTLQILNLTNVLREDVVEESMSTDFTLANAPRKEKGYFKAPKII